ncbi:MAG: methyltransferase domain-containing protein [Oscillospiraceae bacterium]|jgi:tRNA (cmo5U34)-methyltransferase|nr:methyltransferase domain-containing protein [Oscillospiraceae bacterium]
MHRPEPMAQFFNRVAQGYDQHVSEGQQTGGLDGKNILAQHLPAGARDVLDLGCGTGLELPAIFARCPQARVLGIDLAEDMLAILHKRCAGFDVQTLCMSYFDYDYPPERFDAVISVMSLHHFTPEQKLWLYQQAHSALKPGGVLLNCDYIIDSPLREKWNFARLRRMKAAPGSVHFDTPLCLKHEFKLLRQAGFPRAELLWQTKTTRLLSAIKQEQ